MLIAVAERRVLPDLTPLTEFRLTQEWAASPVPSMLETPALEAGASRTRLDKLTGGLRFDLRVNLLPPTATPGAWDSALARECAEALATVMLEEWESSRAVLLGRRVARAFDCAEVPLCRARGRFLVYPHPSGRSRFLNDPANRQRARRALREWLMFTSKENA